MVFSVFLILLVLFISILIIFVLKKKKLGYEFFGSTASLTLNLMFLKYFPKTLFRFFNYPIIFILEIKSSDDSLVFFYLIIIFLYDIIIGILIGFLIRKLIEIISKKNTYK